MEEVEYLNFTSWWWEGQEKHIISLSFHTVEQVAFVSIDNNESQIIEKLANLQGKTVEKWDLFIGSEVDIFGKPTYLKQCDAATAEWNQRRGRQFIHIKNRLKEELEKYDTKPLPKKLLLSYDTNIIGGCNLRGIINQIIEIKEKLSFYRPKLALKIAPPDLFI
ncbi:unnamed protein product [Blepharisma stoltei]|uniref:Uncharacterized protein n=1 Tax=Blepharisma stoltei TaxID=1481888 RepID=A0AAU9JHZ9_9CILI|nr:unnamed protein product [Blepharisma stoltei]